MPWDDTREDWAGRRIAELASLLSVERARVAALEASLAAAEKRLQDQAIRHAAMLLARFEALPLEQRIRTLGELCEAMER